MTSEDIMKLALDAGIRVAFASDTIDPRNVYLHELERFAALVAAAEREACAKVCDDEGLHITASIIRAREQE